MSVAGNGVYPPIALGGRPPPTTAAGQIPPVTVTTVPFSAGARSTTSGTSLHSNTLVVPVLLNYGGHCNGAYGNGTRSVFVSCAGSVRSENYAPECPTEQLPEGATPDLVTMTGSPMNVGGSRRAHYTFPKGRWMIMRYLPFVRRPLPGDKRHRRNVPLRVHRFPRLQTDYVDMAGSPSSGRHYESRVLLLGAEGPGQTEEGHGRLHVRSRRQLLLSYTTRVGHYNTATEGANTTAMRLLYKDYRPQGSCRCAKDG